jgi:hypothetical protein
MLWRVAKRNGETASMSFAAGNHNGGRQGVVPPAYTLSSLGAGAG